MGYKCLDGPLNEVLPDSYYPHSEIQVQTAKAEKWVKIWKGKTWICAHWPVFQFHKVDTALEDSITLHMAMAVGNGLCQAPLECDFLGPCGFCWASIHCVTISAGNKLTFGGGTRVLVKPSEYRCLHHNSVSSTEAGAWPSPVNWMCCVAPHYSVSNLPSYIYTVLMHKHVDVHELSVGNGQCYLDIF